MHEKLEKLPTNPLIQSKSYNFRWQNWKSIQRFCFSALCRFEIYQPSINNCKCLYASHFKIESKCPGFHETFVYIAARLSYAKSTTTTKFVEQKQFQYDESTSSTTVASNSWQQQFQPIQ